MQHHPNTVQALTEREDAGGGEQTVRLASQGGDWLASMQILLKENLQFRGANVLVFLLLFRF